MRQFLGSANGHAWICVIAAFLVSAVHGAEPVAWQQQEVNPPRIKATTQRGGVRRVDPEQRRAEMLGVLMLTNLTLDFEEVPARQVIKELRQALGITIIGRFRDDSVGHGIDPNALITFQADEMPALDVIEAVLQQCAVYEDCTWQLRSSFVELGTKRRLAVPGAREVRIYEIRDLLVEAPYFASIPDADSVHLSRKRPEDLAIEILDLMVDMVEPEAWEQEVQPDPEPEDEPAPGSEDQPPSPEVTRPGQSTPTTTDPSKRGGYVQRSGEQFRRSGKWASARYWRGTLVVRAPDFVHRQLNGYPAPIPPVGAPAERE